jgi:putative copper export protein
MTLTDILTRTFGYSGALLCIGAVVARALLHRSWRESIDAEALERATVRLTWVAFIGALFLPFASWISLTSQALQLVDEGEVLSGAQYTMALASTWADGWRAQAIAGALAILAWIPFRGRPFLGWRLTTVAAIALAATYPLTGHPRSVPVGALFGVLTQSLHVIGAGIWLGTLGVLTLVAWSGDEAGRGSRVQRVIAGFSPVALTGAGLLALSGTITGVQTVGSFGAILGSDYGRTLAIKLLLLGGVAAVGAYNWKVVQPKLATGSGEGLLRRSALAELGVGFLLLAVTALLVTLPAPGLE